MGHFDSRGQKDPPPFGRDDIPDSGTAARAFGALLALVPLEWRGLSDEVVAQRRALRQLSPGFFRYYMGSLGGRRSRG